MSPVREAIVLPLAFLTVALLGGLRIGPTLVLVPPPLISLVLAVMLLSALVQAGVVIPSMILSAERTALENISGVVVLITLFAGSAQVFTLVTPEHGLLHVVFSICFFVQLTTTMAGVKERRNMLRSIAVLLGAAFIVRFIVLEGLYAREGGLATCLVEADGLPHRRRRRDRRHLRRRRLGCGRNLRPHGPGGCEQEGGAQDRDRESTMHARPPLQAPRRRCRDRGRDQARSSG